MEFDKVLTTNKRFSRVNSKEGIIVHHTGSPNYEAMCRLLSGKKKKGDKNPRSVHYVIGQKEGEIAKIGEHDDSLWHVGMGILNPESGAIDSQGAGTKENLNYKMIGIEVCSNGKDYTHEQRQMTIEVIQHILNEEKQIPPEMILRHAHVSGYRGKWDIGENFYMHFGSWSNFQKTFKTALPPVLSLKEMQNSIIIQAKAIWRDAHERGDEKAMKYAHRIAQQARDALNLIG